MKHNMGQLNMSFNVTTEEIRDIEENIDLMKQHFNKISITLDNSSQPKTISVVVIYVVW